jgi:hypothetical protein
MRLTIATFALLLAQEASARRSKLSRKLFNLQNLENKATGTETFYGTHTKATFTVKSDVGANDVLTDVAKHLAAAAAVKQNDNHDEIPVTPPAPANQLRGGHDEIPVTPPADTNDPAIVKKDYPLADANIQAVIEEDLQILKELRARNQEMTADADIAEHAIPSDTFESHPELPVTDPASEDSPDEDDEFPLMDDDNEIMDYEISGLTQDEIAEYSFAPDADIGSVAKQMQGLRGKPEVPVTPPTDITPNADDEFPPVTPDLPESLTMRQGITPNADDEFPPATPDLPESFAMKQQFSGNNLTEDEITEDELSELREEVTELRKEVSDLEANELSDGVNMIEEIPELPTEDGPLDMLDIESVEEIPELPTEDGPLDMLDVESVEEIPELPTEDGPLDILDIESVEEIPELPTEDGPLDKLDEDIDPPVVPFLPNEDMEDEDMPPSTPDVPEGDIVYNKQVNEMRRPDFPSGIPYDVSTEQDSTNSESVAGPGSASSMPQDVAAKQASSGTYMGPYGTFSTNNL